MELTPPIEASKEWILAHARFMSPLNAYNGLMYSRSEFFVDGKSEGGSLLYRTWKFRNSPLSFNEGSLEEKVRLEKEGIGAETWNRPDLRA